MRTRKIDFRVEHEVYEVLQAKAKAAGFDSVPQFFKCTALYEAFHFRRVDWLRKVSNLRKTKLKDLILHEFLMMPTEVEDIEAVAKFMRERRRNAVKTQK